MTVTWTLTIEDSTLYLEHGIAESRADAATSIIEIVHRLSASAASRTRYTFAIDGRAVATLVTGDDHDPQDREDTFELLDRVAAAISSDGGRP